MHQSLPTHPNTGLRALGFGRRGPIWPVLGGSQPTGETQPAPAPPTPAPPAPDAPPAGAPDPDPTVPADLGEAGKRALKAERDARDAERKRGDDLAARLKAIEDRDLSDLDKARNAAEEHRKAAEAATGELLRWRIAGEYGITGADVEDLLTGKTEDVLKRQAERLKAIKGTAVPAVPPVPQPVPSQGPRPGSTKDRGVGAGAQMFAEKHGKTTT